MSKRNIEEEIVEFLGYWNCEKLIGIYKDFLPLIELFESEEEIDWVEELVGKENERNVRTIRLVYLLSKFSSIHSGELVRTNIKFPNLWLKLERIKEEQV